MTTSINLYNEIYVAITLLTILSENFSNGLYLEDDEDDAFIDKVLQTISGKNNNEEGADVLLQLDKNVSKRSYVQEKSPRIWENWSRWSGCSVTCGVGILRRYRRCVSAGCAINEKEEQIKPCNLVPCK